ncbi:MAG: hypothetical protein Q7W16_07110 [Coriobacteriia bacterium]|nr:hypothetical protein [Coriobacteriia bacterium]
MVDEHGRSERRRHVPDVIEREKRRLQTDRVEPVAEPGVAADEGAALVGFSPDTPDTGYWRSLDVVHRRALVGAILAGVGLIALMTVAGYYLLNLREPETPRPRPSSSMPSAIPTTSVEASGSAEVSASAGATSAVAPAGPTAVAMRRPYIAYRAGGSIWVCGEHGGGPHPVYSAGGGVFSLSPNALTLAYVDGASGILRMVDLASGRATTVGPATPLRPEWAFDSTFVVYTRPAPGGQSEEVARVDANGGAARGLLQGWRGRLMPDGKAVIAAPVMAAGGSVGIAVLSDGRRVASTGKVRSEEVCPAIGGLYFADSGGLATTTGGPLSSPSIRWIGYDGKGERMLVARPSASAGVTFAELRLSPDGGWLVYAEAGDDGYSRLYALRTTGGAPVALTPHLDGYFVGWSADGSELLLVEGNAMQGEATRVSAMRPDGSGHRIVVEGGGL